MPRTARASAADYCYHVMNRGNGRAEVFHKRDDYEAFLELIPLASARIPMRVLGYCVMPNHFHLVLRPFGDGDLGRWMQWLLTSQVRRYRRHYGSSGHVWQGRFKAFPCQNDNHLLSVLRYVERNALRAGLVSQAEDWPHGSLHGVANPPALVPLEPLTIPRNAAWIAKVNASMSDQDLASLRNCLQRGSPFGSKLWTTKTATKLGLESTLRPRGRPRKAEK